MAAGIPAKEWPPGLELLAEVAVEWYREEGDESGPDIALHQLCVSSV